MPDTFSDDPLQRKIFPRNLTARADYIVRGNPTITRPESGVDNCYPGLEFDQRNLDKGFFPGLVFEFHRPDGAIVHRILNDGTPGSLGLADADLPLYLWALMGRTEADQNDANPPAFFFYGLNGLEVWRRVHDLLPGRLAILLGSAPGFSAQPADTGVLRLMDQLRDAGESHIERNNGRIAWAVFVGDRARYLDDGGVIDVDAYAPGELTRSLCAPWQYDFRDCGCFYWAASKPDLVASADGEQPYLNFMRRDRAAAAPTDILSQWDRNQEIDYAQLIGGAWNELPVVINDRESERFEAPSAPEVPRLMVRQEVIDELRYLATVEHALCVQYLYAHYSLAAPMILSETETNAQTRRIFAAANEIFRIAVDEMRHLRWVNEALALLGESPSLDRAERIGRVFNRPFELTPLTPEQLQWFIDVEQPSQAINESIDGMYVQLHTSIDLQPKEFPERERLVHLIKLIIDEGEDHYERFLSIQRHLTGIAPEQYLRPLDDAPTQGLQDLSDQHYAVLLRSLQVTFSIGDRAGGLQLEHSRRAMYNLHETNHFMATKGLRARFTLPTAPMASFVAEEAPGLVDTLATSVMAALDVVEQSGEEQERALAQRQRPVVGEVFNQMRRIVAKAEQ